MAARDGPCALCLLIFAGGAARQRQNMYTLSVMLWRAEKSRKKKPNTRFKLHTRVDKVDLLGAVDNHAALGIGHLAAGLLLNVAHEGSLAVLLPLLVLYTRSWGEIGGTRRW